MKKNIFAITATVLMSLPISTYAKVDVCVFDILGKSGEAYKMMQDWALAAKDWGIDANLVAITDEP